jgi:hypothetical protein
MEPPATGPVECEVLTLPDDVHSEEIQIVDEIPAGEGGTLVDGDYELVEHVRYLSEPNEDRPTLMRAALRLRNRARVVDYRVDERDPEERENPKGFTAHVVIDGNDIQLEMICPAMESGSIGYTATKDRLSLFEGNEEMRFARR